MFIWLQTQNYAPHWIIENNLELRFRGQWTPRHYSRAWKGRSSEEQPNHDQLWAPVLLLRFSSGAHSSYLSRAGREYRPRFWGRPAINTISSSRTTMKKKEPPKDDSPNRRWSSAPISASLFRYYSASPNASVIRIDLLDLTIAYAGITLDLDKDWHPDLYVKCDTKR